MKKRTMFAFNVKQTKIKISPRISGMVLGII